MTIHLALDPTTRAIYRRVSRAEQHQMSPRTSVPRASHAENTRTERRETSHPTVAKTTKESKFLLPQPGSIAGLVPETYSSLLVQDTKANDRSTKHQVTSLFAPLVGGRSDIRNIKSSSVWKTKMGILQANHGMLLNRFKKSGSFLSTELSTPDLELLDAHKLFGDHARRDQDLVNTTTHDLLIKHRRWAGVDLSPGRMLWFLPTVLATFKPEWVVLETRSGMQ